MTDKIGKIMSIIDEYKTQFPDSKYKELCDVLMDMSQQTSIKKYKYIILVAIPRTFKNNDDEYTSNTKSLQLHGIVELTSSEYLYALEYIYLPMTRTAHLWTLLKTPCTYEPSDFEDTSYEDNDYLIWVKTPIMFTLVKLDVVV